MDSLTQIVLGAACGEVALGKKLETGPCSLGPLEVRFPIWT